MIRLEITTEARADALAAIRWAEEQRPGRGTLLRESIEQAIEGILTFPEGHRRINARFRRSTLTEFPYVIIYRTRPGLVRIVGIISTHRHPGAIGERLGSINTDSE